MDKKVFIKILIGKEKEDILWSMDKKKLKELEKLFKRCKPVLDRLGRKETTDEDIRNFIKLIEENQTKEILDDLRHLRHLGLPSKTYDAYIKLSDKYRKRL